MPDRVSPIPIDEAGIAKTAKALYEHAQIRTVPRPFERASAPTKATYMAEARAGVSAYLGAVGAQVERRDPERSLAGKVCPSYRLVTNWKPLTDTQKFEPPLTDTEGS